MNVEIDAKLSIDDLKKCYTLLNRSINVSRVDLARSIKEFEPFSNELHELKFKISTSQNSIFDRSEREVLLKVCDVFLKSTHVDVFLDRWPYSNQDISVMSRLRTELSMYLKQQNIDVLSRKHKSCRI